MNTGKTSLLQKKDEMLNSLDLFRMVGTKGFISFEGIDGSGKGTQVELITQKLRRDNPNSLFVNYRDPGSTPSAQEVRNLLVTGELNRWTSTQELFLFSVARISLVNEITHQLQHGVNVIQDRYTDSTIAYQYFMGNLNLSMVSDILNYSTGGIYPVLTFILDIDPETAFERIASRSGVEAAENRFEKRGIEWFRKLRESYLLLASSNPMRYKVIDASASVESVTDKIYNTINKGRYIVT